MIYYMSYIITNITLYKYTFLQLNEATNKYKTLFL